MLSHTADYAIRAVLTLAREGGRRLIRADEIAEATGAPRNYMAKTLHALASHGILTSARGPRGGFALALPPGALTLARIVEVFDAPRPHSRCMLGNRRCDPAHPCATHHRWMAITSARRAPLELTTIAELLGRAGDAPSAVRRASA